MATATTLEEAAGQTFQNLLNKWITGTLKVDLTAFAAAVLPDFPEQIRANHPIGNWASVIGCQSALMAAGNSHTQVPYQQVVVATDYVYRICWMGSQLAAQGSITTAQRDALLADYNAAF